MNNTQKFFIIALVVNGLYLIITFFFFYFLDNFLMSSENTDYLTFHNAGLIAIKNLPELYDPSHYLFPFRYLPLSAYFFTPFSLLGLELGYLMFQLFNFFLNFVTIYLIYKIIIFYRIQKLVPSLKFNLNSFKNIFRESENKSLLHHGSAYLLILPQFMNYFLGQTNMIVLIFILTSLFYLIKGGNKNDFLGGLMLGFGILFKPTLILIVPFIIPISYNKLNRKLNLQFKKTIIRLCGPVILIILSGLFFLANPQMLIDFMDVNLAGQYVYNIGGSVEINPSFSLTRIILIISELIGLKFNNFITFIAITLIIWAILYIFFIFSPTQSNRLVMGFLSGISVMLIVYFDSWPHHLIVLTPFMILFILLNKDFKRIELFKYVCYLLTNLTLAFWVIYYLTYEFLPVNIGGLLLLLLLYYNLIIFYRQKNQEINSIKIK